MPITINNEARSLAHLFAEPDIDLIDIEDWQTFAWMFVGVLPQTMGPILLTGPVMVVTATSRPMLMAASLYASQVAAPSRAMAVVASSRSTARMAPPRTMLVVSTLASVTVTALARPMTVFASTRS
jgi:hypothetical protein